MKLFSVFRRKLGDHMNQRETAQLLELTTKCARRCAHDLAHAADSLDMIGISYPRIREEAAEYRERARHWLTIFNPANGPKNYRARILLELEVAHDMNDRLKKLCDKHGIDWADDDDIPF